jgi:serine/threonine-protein kinase
LRDAGTVREVEIALDVFDKGGGFDSRTDPIVRVEARRLRKTLSAYYETVGAADPISIALPTRGYTPKFQLRGNKRPAPMPPARNAEIRTSAGGPSVAVLPFLNMTNEDAQDVFCQGVTEELINALTHVDDLKVASRTSAFQFKGMAVDLRTVGKDLGVQTVVEGSIRLDGDRLRITAQLSSAADGFHLWSETFDATMSDPFQVQESLAREMASRIADQLHAS